MLSLFHNIPESVWQQTSPCLFLHVGPHPITSALSGLSPRGTIDFSHAGFLLMTQHIVQPISKAFPTPASPGALHACGVCMSGFDLEAKHGSVPGLRVSYTRRWAKPSSCRPFTCLEPHSASEITGPQKTLGLLNWHSLGIIQIIVFSACFYICCLLATF